MQFRTLSKYKENRRVIPLNIIELFVQTTREEILHFLESTKENNHDIEINYECEGGIFRCTWNPDSGHPTKSFFKELHELCEQVSIPPQRINVYWNNLNSASLYDTWCKRNEITERFKLVGCRASPLLTAEVNPDTHDFYMNNRETKRPYLFSCLVAAARPHRIDLLNNLYRGRNELKDVVWSFLSTTPFMPGFPNTRLLPQLQAQIPKAVDDAETVFDASYHLKRGEDFWHAFTDSYFDVVPCTHYHNDAVYYPEFEWWKTVDVCEKIGRSIANMRPFVVVGNQFSLYHLKKMGFKTFPHIFDESYDELEDSTRLTAISSQLIRMKHQHIHDAVNSDQTKDILQHNLALLLKLKDLFEQGEGKVFEF